MKITNTKAYVKLPLHLLVVDKFKGFRCSDDALKTSKKTSKYHFLENVYSVEIDGEIIWISDREFKKGGYVERSLCKEEFEGVKK